MTTTRIVFSRFDEAPDAADYVELCRPGAWQSGMREEDSGLKSEAFPLVLGTLRVAGAPMPLPAICEVIADLAQPPMPVTVHGAALVALAVLMAEEIGIVVRDGDAFALAYPAGQQGAPVGGNMAAVARFLDGGGGARGQRF